MAAIAGILLVAGGLGALQSASVLFGAPFALIMVLMCLAFYLHLRGEGRSAREDQEDIPLAPRARRTPSAGETFAAEEPAPGYNRQPGIEKPGREGR
jgi:glycine betaine transporter